MDETKILVVDDDEKILFAFHELFEKDGYASIEAKGGAEALRKFEAEHPHVIFLDVVLPDMNGIEVLKHIRQQGSAVPVVVISGKGTSQTDSEARQLGAFEYLTKPLSVAKVREVIHSALSLSAT